MGNWFARTIDGDGLEEQTAIARTNGNLCVAYQSIDWNLSYVSGLDSDWQSQIIDDIGEVGQHVSMQCGPSGKRYISYGGQGALWLATVE